MAQSVKISGKVVDDSTGSPLELGSTVFLSDQKGKVIDGIATQTNPDGSFELNVPLVVFNPPLMPPILIPKSSHIGFRSNVTGSHEQKLIPITKDTKKYNVRLPSNKIMMEQDVEGVDIYGKRKEASPDIKNNTLLYVGFGLIALALVGTAYYGHTKGWFKS